MNVEGLVFAGIASPDAPELARFLGAVLGVEVDEQGEGFQSLSFPNGSMVALVPPDWITPPSDTNLGFLVDDVEDAAVELARRDVKAEGPVLRSPTFRYQHFRAPDGRTFELLDRRI